MKKALLLVVSHLAVAAAAAVYILDVVETRGVGTWDGRNGSQSLGNAAKGGTWCRDNDEFDENHIVWISRVYWWWPWETEKRKLIKEAMAKLCHDDWNSSEDKSFWGRVRTLTDDSKFKEVIDSIVGGKADWNVRAYCDTNESNGQQYYALEFTKTKCKP